jgi:hypothetical protein
MSIAWRVAGALGGVLGLGSLFQHYVRLTGSVAGIELVRDDLTLFDLVDLAERTDGDPESVQLLIVVIAIGSVLALVGAFVSASLAALGGIVQAVAAAWFALSISDIGGTVLGIASVEFSFETGFFVLVLAGLCSLSALVVE